MTLTTTKRHHLHSPLRRGLYSFFLIVFVMGLGTFGMRVIEHMSFVDAFYFMSMIATAQGPTFSPHTSAGKYFAALMSFISVGSVVASLGFLFGPLLGMLWRIGGHKLDEEVTHLNKKG